MIISVLKKYLNQLKSLDLKTAKIIQSKIAPVEWSRTISNTNDSAVNITLKNRLYISLEASLVVQQRLYTR